MAVIYVPPDRRMELIGQGLGQGISAAIQTYQDQQSLQQALQALNAGGPAPTVGRTQQLTADQGQVAPITNVPSGTEGEPLPQPPDFSAAEAIAAKSSPRAAEAIHKMVESRRWQYQQEISTAREARQERRDVAKLGMERERTDIAVTREQREAVAEATRLELDRIRTNIAADRERHERELDPLKRQELIGRIQKNQFELTQLQQAGDLQSQANTAPAGGHALDGVPESEKTIISQMVHGDIAPPSSYALARPGAQGLWASRLALASKLDPSFTETRWAERVQTTKDFAPGGKDGQALRAGSTAILHAGLLLDAYKQLGNGNVTAFNAIKNQVRSSMADDPSLTNFRTVEQALTSELRKFFAAAGGGGLTELHEWAANLTPSAGPQKAAGSIEKIMQLMMSQYETFSDRWNSTMGQNLSPTDDKFMGAHAREMLKTVLGQDIVSPTGRASVTGQPAASPAAVPREKEERVKAAVTDYQKGAHTQARFNALKGRLKALGFSDADIDGALAGSEPTGLGAGAGGTAPSGAANTQPAPQ